MSTESNWWEHFFEGIAVELWVRALPPEHNEREAESIATALGVAPGARLLDVPCGAGRVAMPLAGRGYRVTGVDWSDGFLAHARQTDTDQVVTWERRDMRDLPWTDRFDGAYCVGNSFGYLDDEGNAAFLRAVARALKPGARFVLETPMILENLFEHIQERNWWALDDTRLLVVNRYDPLRQRLDIEYTFVQNGDVTVKNGSHAAFTCRELIAMMDAAGFDTVLDRLWTQDAEDLVFVGTRR